MEKENRASPCLAPIKIWSRGIRPTPYEVTLQEIHLLLFLISFSSSQEKKKKRKKSINQPNNQRTQNTKK